MLLALQALQNDPTLKLRRAAIIYTVNPITLWRRQKGIQSQRDITPKSRRLSNLEEQILKHFILNLDSRGFPPRLCSVKAMADQLLADRDALLVGTRWALNFIKRYLALKTHFFHKYNY